MEPIKFTMDFPEGEMRRNGPPKPVPRDWIAVGVTSSPVSFIVPEAIPAGSVLTLLETIPDTYAHVSPFAGVGYVLGFTNSYILTIAPPSPVVSLPQE
jgi:hypothetical protein